MLLCLYVGTVTLTCIATSNILPLVASYLTLDSFTETIPPTYVRILCVCLVCVLSVRVLSVHVLSVQVLSMRVLSVCVCVCVCVCA